MNNYFNFFKVRCSHILQYSMKNKDELKSDLIFSNKICNFHTHFSEVVKISSVIYAEKLLCILSAISRKALRLTVWLTRHDFIIRLRYYSPQLTIVDSN